MTKHTLNLKCAADPIGSHTVDIAILDSHEILSIDTPCDLQAADAIERLGGGMTCAGFVTKFRHLIKGDDVGGNGYWNAKEWARAAFVAAKEKREKRKVASMYKFSRAYETYEAIALYLAHQSGAQKVTFYGPKKVDVKKDGTMTTYMRMPEGNWALGPGPGDAEALHALEALPESFWRYAER
jgi:hypothetical protein